MKEMVCRCQGHEWPLKKLIASNDDKISSLQVDVKNSKPIIDTVDLTYDEASEPSKKSARATEPAAKCNLAI